jgi:hypothetical protein
MNAFYPCIDGCEGTFDFGVRKNLLRGQFLGFFSSKNKVRVNYKAEACDE